MFFQQLTRAKLGLQGPILGSKMGLCRPPGVNPKTHQTRNHKFTNDV